MSPLLASLVGSRLWAMEPIALGSFLDAAGEIRTELLGRLAFDFQDAGDDSGDEKSEDISGTISGGVARIPVTGVLLKSGAWMYRAFGIEATDYQEIAAAIAAAESNPDVSSVLFVVDSPGGDASGIHAMVDTIGAMTKPSASFVETLCASAAYWIASASGSISAGRGAQIGSIGAYMAIADYSQAANDAGIKVHVISSGPFKGAGVPGSVITDAQLANMQAHIDELATEFINDVAAGRGMDATAVRELADGRVYSTVEAEKLGLIDSVGSDTSKDDNNMAADLKILAALVKEHPAHAAFIMESAGAGKVEAEIRSAIAKTEDDAARAKLAADLAEKEAALAKVSAEAVASAEKIAKLEKDLADVTAKHAALSKIADGAAPANKVKTDPGEKPLLKKSQDELATMSGLELAKFYNAGGVAE